MIKKYKEIWIPLLCFLVIIILLLFNYALPIDLWFYHKIAFFIHEPLTTILKGITFLGEPKTIVVFAIIWFIILWKKDQKEIKPFLLLLFLSLCFIVFLKAIFVRERPNILQLIPIDGYSFPSGHSIISVSFYGYLMTYMIENQKSKLLTITITVLLIFGIGISRIYLGVHYLSDVLAGYSIGTFILGISNLLRRKKEIV